MLDLVLGQSLPCRTPETKDQESSQGRSHAPDGLRKKVNKPKRLNLNGVELPRLHHFHSCLAALG